MKSVQFRVFSGPYFSVNLRIQSEYRKIRTRKNTMFGHLTRSVVLAVLHHIYSFDYKTLLIMTGLQYIIFRGVQTPHPSKCNPSLCSPPILDIHVSPPYLFFSKGNQKSYLLQCTVSLLKFVALLRLKITCNV